MAVAIGLGYLAGCSGSPGETVTAGTAVSVPPRESQIGDGLTEEQLAEFARLDGELVAETQRAALEAVGKDPAEVPPGHLRFVGPNGPVLVAIADLPALRAEADEAARQRLGDRAGNELKFAFGIRTDGNYGVVAVYRCEPSLAGERNVCQQDRELSEVVRGTSEAPPR